MDAPAGVAFFDRERETAPVERLRAWQWERLGAGLREVWTTNPFWRARYVVDEFQIEVYRRGALDEVRLLLEIDGHAPDAVAERVGEAVRRDVGIRVEVAAVPARSLPRYEMKARRVVRRADETGATGGGRP